VPSAASRATSPSRSSWQASPAWGDPDWNPHDHPRNQDGHFVKKGTGTFLFGKVKKAVFHHPLGGGSTDYTLNPGDIAYKSKTGNIYLKHPDGSGSFLTTVGNEKKLAADDPLNQAYLKKISQGSFTPFDSSPATEVAANSEEEAKAALNKPVKVGDAVDWAQLPFMPKGAQVNLGGSVVLTKQDDGSWKSASGGLNIDPSGVVHTSSGDVVKPVSKPTVTSLGNKVEGQPEQPAEKIDADFKVGDEVFNADMLDSLPVGTQIDQYDNNNKHSDIETWTKQPSGKWTIGDSNFEADAEGVLAVDDEEDWVNTIKRLPSGDKGSGKAQDAPQGAPKTSFGTSFGTDADLNAEAKAALDSTSSLNQHTITKKSVPAKKSVATPPLKKAPSSSTGEADLGEFELKHDPSEPPTLSELTSAPVGSTVTFNQLGKSSTATKKSDGKWHGTLASGGHSALDSGTLATAGSIGKDFGLKLNKPDDAPTSPKSPDNAEAADKVKSMVAKLKADKAATKAGLDALANPKDSNADPFGPDNWEQALLPQPNAPEAPNGPEAPKTLAEKLSALDSKSVGQAITVTDNLTGDDQKYTKLPSGNWAKYGTGAKGLEPTKFIQSLEKNNGYTIQYDPDDLAAKKAQSAQLNAEAAMEAEKNKSPESPKTGGISASVFQVAPVGSTFTFSPGGNSPTKTYIKRADGTWESDTGHKGLSDKLLSMLSGANPGTNLLKSPAKKSPSQAEIDKGLAEQAAVLDALPDGSTVKSESGLSTYVKKNGLWKDKYNPFDAEQPSAALVKYDSIDTTGLPDKKSALDDLKTKVAAKKAEPVAVPGKKNKLTAANPDDNFEANGTYTPVAGEPNLPVDKKYGFVHPVSLEEFPLEKGDVLLQHTKTPESFAVVGADGTKKYQVNKLGKKYKWSPHIPKSNYKAIYTEDQGSDTFDPQAEALPDANQFIKGNTFTHPVSGLKLDIGEDEKLLAHNFTPNSYLVVGNDGSMKYKIDVKGNKQKAGTNLKPSNYHEVLEGKPKPPPKNFSDQGGKYKLGSLADLKTDLAEAVPGDHISTVDGTYTKSDTGKWVSPDGFMHLSDNQVIGQLPVFQTMPDKGTKSDHGVPLNEIEMTDWASKQPVGTTLSADYGDDGWTATKIDQYDWQLKEGDQPSFEVGSVSLAASMNDKLDAEGKKSLKSEAPVEKNNAQGFPVNGTQAEVQSYLDDLPPEAQIGYTSPYDNTWQGLYHKSPDGQWFSINGYAANDLAAKIGTLQGTTKDLLGTDLTNVKKSKPAPSKGPVKSYTSANAQGVPIGDENEALDFLSSLPVGSIIGHPATGMKNIMANKGSVYHKTGPNEWKVSNQGAKGALSDMTVSDEKFANLLANSKSQHIKDTIKIVSSPGAVGKVAQKTTASKAKAGKADAPAGPTPTKTFTSAADVTAYITGPKKSYYSQKHASFFNDLFVGLQGGEYHPDSGGYLGTSYQVNPLGKYHGVPNPINTWEDRLSAIASPEFAKSIDDVITNLTFAKASKDLGVLPGDKAKMNTLLKKLQHLKSIHEAAVSLKAGELPEQMPDPDFKWGTKATWDLDMSAFSSTLQKFYQETKFKKDSENLGFDVFNGSEAQYKDYLKANGINYADYLTPDQAKSLALHTMNAPGAKIGYWQIQGMENNAKAAQFASKATDALAAKNGVPFTPKFAPSGVKFPSKPSFLGVSDWDAIQYALSTDWSPSNPGADDPNWLNSLGPSAKNIPPEAAKALHEALEGLQKTNLAKTVSSYLLKSGIWNENKLTFEHEKGNFAVAPGMKVYQTGSGQLYFIPKNGLPEDVGTAQAAYFDTDGLFETGYYSEASLKSMELLYTAPAEITKGDAKAAGLDFTDADWDALTNLEGHIPGKEPSGPESVTLAKILTDHPVTPTDLSDKAKALILHSPNLADLVVYKDQQGSYRVSQAAQEKWSDFTKSAPKHMGKITDPTNTVQVVEAIKTFTPAQVDAGLKALGVPDDPQLDDIGKAAQLKDKTLAFGAQVNPAPLPSKSVGVSGSLKPLANLGMGGGMPKKYFADANGERYMAKPSTGKEFRADTEQAAGDVASMFGFTTPESTVRTIDGDYMHIQHIVSSAGDLSGVQIKDMSDAQLINVMTAHVLDWGVSNHDTHDGNFLRAPEGDGIIKIDMGQAWKALGSDKLEVGWTMPGNFGGIWYDKFYKDVQAGKISRDRADLVTKAVLKKAKQFSTKREDEYRAQLEAAFKNRTSFPKGMSKAKYIDLAMQRKHDTFDDFFKLYKGIYAKAGYNFDFDPAKFETTQLDGNDAHLSLSSDLVDQVAAFGSYGKSLFFNSKDVEDSHVLLWATKDGKGGKNFRGDMQIRPDGDAKVMQFLSQHGVNTGPTAAAADPTKPQDDLPNATQVFGQLVNLAKTVSSHSGDGNYTQSTVNAAKQAQATLKSQLAAVQASIEKDPLYVAKGPVAPAFTPNTPIFQTGHQQQAWIEWATDLIPKFDVTLDAMGKGEKSPKWGQDSPVYKAPTGIDISGKPKAVEELTGPSGAKFTKYSDFNYVGPDGPISESEYQALQTGDGWTTKTLKTDETPETSSTQVAPAKSYTVTKTKFGTPAFTDKPDENGFLTEKANLQTFSADAYEVTSSTNPNIKVLYAAHNGMHGDQTNQGRLQFKIENFDGSDAQVQAALDLVKDMGVDLTEADESSMELFFWRHQAGILNDRQLGHTGKSGETWKAIKEGEKQNLSPEAELKMLKDAFALSMGQETVDKADWKPKFNNGRQALKTFDGEQTGRPYWMRPDFDLKAYKEHTKGLPPSRTFWNTQGGDASTSGIRPYQTGMFLSGEERVKFTGTFATGAGSSGSSSTATDRGMGGSGVIFTRQGQKPTSNAQYFEPSVAGRTHTFAHASDIFGGTSSKNSGSPWDLKDAAYKGKNRNGGSSNEMDIKYGASAWDDLAVTIVDAASRKKILDYLKSLGITTIRGLPIEERVVSTEADLNKTLDKVWDMAIKAQEEAKKK
jgi:hypothetical protein